MSLSLTRREFCQVAGLALTLSALGCSENSSTTKASEVEIIYDHLAYYDTPVGKLTLTAALRHARLLSGVRKENHLVLPDGGEVFLPPSISNPSVLTSRAVAAWNQGNLEDVTYAADNIQFTPPPLLSDTSSRLVVAREDAGVPDELIGWTAGIAARVYRLTLNFLATERPNNLTRDRIEFFLNKNNHLNAGLLIAREDRLVWRDKSEGLVALGEIGGGVADEQAGCLNFVVAEASPRAMIENMTVAFADLFVTPRGMSTTRIARAISNVFIYANPEPWVDYQDSVFGPLDGRTRF